MEALPTRSLLRQMTFWSASKVPFCNNKKNKGEERLDQEADETRAGGKENLDFDEAGALSKDNLKRAVELGAPEAGLGMHGERGEGVPGPLGVGKDGLARVRMREGELLLVGERVDGGIQASPFPSPRPHQVPNPFHC